MITIELIGSYIAKHVESGTIADQSGKKNRRTTKSPIPVLCRALLQKGLEGQERVHIIRLAVSGDRHIPVFKVDRQLSVWAGLDCIENDARGPHIVKHRPFSSPQGVPGSQGALIGGIDVPKERTLEIAANGNSFSMEENANAA